MSKAIEGAAMLAGAVSMGAAAFLDPPLVFSAFYDKIWASLVVGGVAMEAGAIADALTQNRSMGITTRQPAAYRQVVYGTQRIGGVMVYTSTTGGNLDQYNFIIVLAGHEINAIQNLYLDGRQVFWTGSGTGNSTRNGINFGGNANSDAQIGPGGQHYNFGGLVYCEVRYGDQPIGDIIGAMTANDPNWAASSSGTPSLQGCCYVYLKIEFDPSMFPNLPEIKFDVQGKNNIWDPRTSTYGYTANWALVVADVLTDPNFGLGDNTVNQAQLIAAANVCDELVDLADGDQEARYNCHWHYDTSVAPGDALQTMMPAAAGRLSRIGGEWYIWPAYWQGASATFDESAITGKVQWNPNRSARDLINRVNGTYIAPNSPYNVAGNLYDPNGWYEGTIANQFPYAFQPTNYPQYAQDVLHGYAEDIWLDEDSGSLGDWSSTATYNLGDVVIYEGVLYQSLAASNMDNTPAAPVLSGDWTAWPAGSPPATVNNWSASTAYAEGDVVSYDGALYSAASANTGVPPTAVPWWAVYFGNQLPKEVTQNCVLSIAQAQRCAKIFLLRNRFQGSGAIPLSLTAWSELQPLDVLQLAFLELGWTAQQLEILSTVFTIDSSGADDQAPTVRFSVTVGETDESIYEWDADTEELSPYDVPANPPQLPYLVTPPSGLTLSSEPVFGEDGIVIPRILATWTPPGDARVTGIQIQYQLSGAGSWTNGDLVNAETFYDFITGVVAGQTYNVQIASVTAAGAMSVWVGATITVTAPNSLQSTYTNNPQFALTQPTSTTIDVAAIAVSFGGATAVNYAARALTISAPGTPTWYYITIADPTQQGESGSPTLTATASTSNALVGVQGNTYIGAILALPGGSAVSSLAGGWPAPPTYQVES